MYYLNIFSLCIGQVKIHRYELTNTRRNRENLNQSASRCVPVPTLKPKKKLNKKNTLILMLNI